MGKIDVFDERTKEARYRNAVIGEKLYCMMYTILRRAICGRTKQHIKKYNVSDLEKLCEELEMKDINQLKEIHKKWSGYI